MTRVIVDADTRSKLHNLTEMLELCDESGRLLATLFPAPDLLPRLQPRVSEGAPRPSNPRKSATARGSARASGAAVMFRVEWLQSALDELAEVWTEADSPARQAITAAAHRIEQLLQSQPHAQGESRAEGQRCRRAAPGRQFPRGSRRSRRCPACLAVSLTRIGLHSADGKVRPRRISCSRRRSSCQARVVP